MDARGRAVEAEVEFDFAGAILHHGLSIVNARVPIFVKDVQPNFAPSGAGVAAALRNVLTVQNGLKSPASHFRKQVAANFGIRFARVCPRSKRCPRMKEPLFLSRKFSDPQN